MDISVSDRNLKTAYWIAMVFLFCLLVGSVFYYQERMLFVDPAFITFEIINSEWFVFSEFRYGAFVTQMFPLAGVKLGWSLKTILMMYSVSFYLFYLFVFLFCGLVLKQYKYGILLVLYLSLLVSDVYFWPNNEIHQAVGWGLLFLSLYGWAEMKSWRVSRLTHIALVLVLGLALISHLIFTVPFIYLWVYRYLARGENEKVNLKLTVIYSVLAGIVVALRYWLSHNSWYDGVKLEGMKSLTVSDAINCFTSEQAKSLGALLISTHWVIIPVFLIGVASLIYHRNYLQAGWTIFSVMSYFIIVTVTHPQAIEPSSIFYYESQWTSWTLILALPFVDKIIELMPHRRVVLLIMLCLFISKLPGLMRSLDKFQYRLETLKEVYNKADSNETSKVLLEYDAELDQRLLMTWGLPVETLLYSTLKNKSQATSIKLVDKQFAQTASLDSVYTAFALLPSGRLNADYFVTDTSQAYLKIAWKN